MPVNSRMLALAFALLATSATQAQVYKWVDANGQTHFGNAPSVPEQPVEAVNVRLGYEGTAPDVATETDNAAASGGDGEAPKTAQSQKEMCNEAMRWTRIDIPNLKEIAEQRLKDQKITREQYRESTRALDQVDSSITMTDCVTSKGSALERYQCLSRGAGVLVCSGALEGLL